MKQPFSWKSCLNPKILLGLGVVAAVIWYFFRDQLNITALLPFLFILMCPLSMLFMMKGMNGKSHCEMDHAKPDAEKNTEKKSL